MTNEMIKTIAEAMVYTAEYDSKENAKDIAKALFEDFSIIDQYLIMMSFKAANYILYFKFAELLKIPYYGSHSIYRNIMDNWVMIDNQSDYISADDIKTTMSRYTDIFKSVMKD